MPMTFNMRHTEKIYNNFWFSEYLFFPSRIRRSFKKVSKKIFFLFAAHPNFHQMKRKSSKCFHWNKLQKVVNWIEWHVLVACRSDITTLFAHTFSSSMYICTCIYSVYYSCCLFFFLSASFHFIDSALFIKQFFFSFLFKESISCPVLRRPKVSAPATRLSIATKKYFPLY